MEIYGKHLKERRYPCKNTHDVKGKENMNTKDAVNYLRKMQTLKLCKSVFSNNAEK